MRLQIHRPDANPACRQNLLNDSRRLTLFPDSIRSSGGNFSNGE
jgi:hypothetical protein